MESSMAKSGSYVKPAYQSKYHFKIQKELDAINHYQKLKIDRAKRVIEKQKSYWDEYVHNVIHPRQDPTMNVLQ